MNLGAYFFSDRLVLVMHHTREVPRDEASGLHRPVEDLARRADIPTPRLYMIPQAQPNVATGRRPEHGVVALTECIVEVSTPATTAPG